MAQEPVVRKKPQLKGLVVDKYARALYMSVGTAMLLGVFLKYQYLDKKFKRIEDYYVNLDPDKEYQIMKKTGIFKGYEA